MRKIIVNLSIILMTFVVSFIAIEIVIRILGTTGENGQFYFNDRPLRPYAIPYDELQIEEIQERLANDEIRWIPDPLVGWKPAPSFTWSDEYTDYRHNSINLRSDQEFELQPQDGVLRIGLFGDSYTFGSASKLEDTWAYHLEQELEALGIPTEVMNFGVGGFGMDQAYLRWLHEGKAYQPDIVIFGYMIADIPRNANIFRGLLRLNNQGRMTGNVYSKPRFVNENGDLKLLNSPAVGIDELYDAYVNLDSSPLRDYDMFYDPDRKNILLESKFIALLFDTLSSESPSITGKDEFSEGNQQLAIEIIDMFAQGARDEESQFMAVYLPLLEDIQLEDNQKANRAPLVYEHLTNVYDMVNPVPLMPRETEPYTEHYAAPIGSIIGKQLADYIYDCFDDSCQPIRFR